MAAARQRNVKVNGTGFHRDRVRLDGAFCDKPMTSALDVKRLGGCIVAKMTQPLKDRLVAAPPTTPSAKAGRPTS